MRPLERSLEKLDDVRRKKLSEMISSSEGAVSACSSSGLFPSFFFLDFYPVVIAVNLVFFYSV